MFSQPKPSPSGSELLGRQTGLLESLAAVTRSGVLPLVAVGALPLDVDPIMQVSLSSQPNPSPLLSLDRYLQICLFRVLAKFSVLLPSTMQLRLFSQPHPSRSGSVFGFWQTGVDAYVNPLRPNKSRPMSGEFLVNKRPDIARAPSVNKNLTCGSFLKLDVEFIYNEALRIQVFHYHYFLEGFEFGRALRDFFRITFLSKEQIS